MAIARQASYTWGNSASREIGPSDRVRQNPIFAHQEVAVMTRRVCLMTFSMFMVWCCAVLWVRGSDPDMGKKTITNSIGMKLVLIPAGEFLMGSPEGEAEREDDEYQHRVRITKSFYLGVYEVTQGEYEQVMGTNPSYFAPGRPWTRPADFAGQGTSHFPVEQLSWHDAVEFCRKLSARWAESSVGRVYRLPTEAEWEYACRASTTTPFHFGATLNGREANCDANFPYGTKVGGIDLFADDESGFVRSERVWVVRHAR